MILEILGYHGADVVLGHLLSREAECKAGIITPLA